MLMHAGRTVLCIFTVFLILLILFAGIAGEAVDMVKTAEISLSFEIEMGESTERIYSWADEEGALYVFLPGYIQMNQIFLVPERGNISIDNFLVTGRMSCADYELNRAYPVSCAVEDAVFQSTIMFVRSGGVPSLHIDIQSNSMEYIHLEKGNKESGSYRLYEADGRLGNSGLLDYVEGRGNSSWGAEKKPYNMMLSQEADILGMGAAHRWVLLSEGYNALNIRNKIVYDFADAAGLPWSPDCEWVDLYLNGEYAGLYLLSERNEIHEERIDISSEGGFLVSLEYENRLKEQKYPYVITQSGQALRIRQGEINTVELQQRWQSLENAILSECGIDPVSGKHWRDLLDLDSWARKYLIEEIFGNVDAGSLSQYYYADGNDIQRKIYAGPVWDYDFAMGGESVWLKPYSNYFTMNRTYVNEDVYTPWFPSLYQQREFQDRVKELYVQQFLPLIQTLISDLIPEYADKILLSARMDGIRWSLVWEDISGEVQYILSFLEERTAFLTDLWVNESVYHTVYVDPGRYGIYGCFAVKNGESLPPLLQSEEIVGADWYDAETELPFDITQRIVEDAHIYLRNPETNLPVIHYAPAVVVFLVLLMLLLLDNSRTKKNGGQRSDPAKVK